MVVLAEFGFAGFWDCYRGCNSQSREKKMEKTNVSEFGSEVRVSEDDIPGAKVQMNDNLVPCSGPRRLKQNSAQATTCF